MCARNRDRTSRQAQWTGCYRGRVPAVVIRNAEDAERRSRLSRGQRPSSDDGAAGGRSGASKASAMRQRYRAGRQQTVGMGTDVDIPDWLVKVYMSLTLANYPLAGTRNIRHRSRTSPALPHHATFWHSTDQQSPASITATSVRLSGALQELHCLVYTKLVISNRKKERQDVYLDAFLHSFVP